MDEATAEYVHIISTATGNPITLPEIQILRSGMTVGGRRLPDHNEVVDLLSAFHYLRVRTMRSVESRIAFNLDRQTLCKIHELALRHKDDDPGKFRGEGTSGIVQTFNFGSAYRATPSDDGGEELRKEAATEFLKAIIDPTEMALAYYCLGVRNRFFLDGNKRTALLTANGLLTQARRPAITVEPAQLTSLNEVIDEFRYLGDATAVMSALCEHIDPLSSGRATAPRDMRTWQADLEWQHPEKLRRK